MGKLLTVSSFNIIRRPGEKDPGDAMMACDAVRGCAYSVRRAPRIVIPSRTPFEPLHRPFKIMTDLHYCEAHVGHFRNEDVAAYLTDARKAEIEDMAKICRPAGFKPDFEQATYEMVLTTTPEYRAYLQSLGFSRVIA